MGINMTEMSRKIRVRAGLAKISEKMREARLRWLAHVCRSKERGICRNESMED